MKRFLRVVLSVLLSVAIAVGFVVIPIPVLNPIQRVYAVGDFSMRTIAIADDSSQIETTAVFDNTLAYMTFGKTAAGTGLSSAMVFDGINIPDDCYVVSAYITFTASASLSGAMTATTIWAEDTAAPADYGAAEDFTARTYTTDYEAWTPGSWVSGTTYDTVDIKDVVQELLDSYGAYVAGSMAFYVRHLGGAAGLVNRKAYSFDGDPTKAPLLVIDYAPYDAYWVGASGAWSEAATHWAMSTGGAPNAAYLPYLQTSVHFDANSGFVGGDKTVSLANSYIAYCQNMVWTGAPNSPIYAMGASARTQVYGSMTLIATMSVTGLSSQFTFPGTGVYTITTGGIAMNINYFEFAGVGGVWTLQDSLSVTGGGATNNGIKVTKGKLDTNDKAVTCAEFNISNTNVRELDLGASVLTVSSAWNATTTTNLTFTAGTSVIKCIGTCQFVGGGLTYNEVQFNGTAHTVSGVNYFTTLTRTSTATKTDTLTLSDNQTITGTLTLNGNSATNRLLVQSNTPATYRTLYAATVSASNVDFLDIQGAGASSWNLSAITGGSGNAGHNAGITFTTPVNSYWVDNTGSWSDITYWSNTSGGVGGLQRVPLVQDTAVFDALSFNIDSRIVTMDMPRSSNFDMTTVTRTPQFDGNGSGGGSVYLYGTSYKLGSVNFTPAYTYSYGRGTVKFYSQGYSLDTSFISYNYGAVFELQDTMTIIINGTTNGFWQRAGTLNLNGQKLTTPWFDSSSATYARSLAWDSMTTSGTLELSYYDSSNYAWYVSTTLFTMGVNTGTLRFHGDSGAGNRTLQSGTSAITTFNNIVVEGDENYNFIVGGFGFTCNTFTVDRSEATKTISGNYIITLNTGLDIPVVGTTDVTITNTDFTKAGGGFVSSDYLIISGSAALPTPGTFYAGLNSHDNGGNSGWSFTAPTLPTITTGTATDLALYTATLNGAVNAMGTFTPLYVFFQYSLTGTYTGEEIDTVPEQTCTIAGSFSKGIAALSPDTDYHFRIVVRYNISDYTYGADGTFNTSGKPVVSTGDAVVDTDALSATLQGNLTSLGIYPTVSVYFEYGKTTAYGTPTTPYNTLVVVAFTDTIIGLAADTTYHFRAVALYSTGLKVYGSDVTFSTSVEGIPGLGVGKVEDLVGTVLGSPVVLNIGSNTVQVTGLGTLTVTLYNGIVATASTGTTTVSGSPVSLTAGVTIITTSGIVGTITIFCEMANPDAIQFGTGVVPGKKAFYNILEDGDMAFMAEVYVKYNAPPTVFTAGQAFSFLVLNNAGTIVLTSTPLIEYGDRPIGIYFTAANVNSLGLAENTLYKYRVSGNPTIFPTLTEGINMRTLTLTIGDWADMSLATDTIDVLREFILGRWIIKGMVYNINTTDNPTPDYYMTSGGKYYLNASGSPSGQTIFLEGIPGLDRMCPTCFQTSVFPMKVVTPPSTGAGQTPLTVTNKLGSQTAKTMAAITVALGLPNTTAGQTVSGLIVTIALLVALLYWLSKRGFADQRILAVMALFVLGACTIFGILPMAGLFVIITVIALITMFYFLAKGV